MVPMSAEVTIHHSHWRGRGRGLLIADRFIHDKADEISNENI